MPFRPSLATVASYQLDILLARSGDMVVALKDIDGVSVFSQRLHARQWDRYDD